MGSVSIWIFLKASMNLKKKSQGRVLKVNSSFIYTVYIQYKQNAYSFTQNDIKKSSNILPLLRLFQNIMSEKTSIKHSAQ